MNLLRKGRGKNEGNTFHKIRLGKSKNNANIRDGAKKWEKEREIKKFTNKWRNGKGSRMEREKKRGMYKNSNQRQMIRVIVYPTA